MKIYEDEDTTIYINQTKSIESKLNVVVIILVLILMTATTVGGVGLLIYALKELYSY